MLRIIENMIAWMKHLDNSVYQHIRKGYILLPGTDHILDHTALMASASQCPVKISIVQTSSSSHFITLADRSWIPNLIPLSDTIAV